ncbi:hypothetical protein [Mucilaginibacter sp.]|uniref:hypothetical protein n=1 Tax=Mucilaginibacter sp. TaxID=1882438 RepID=UPI00261A2AD8|nr:hypothetical protein [Mucilaginibacter sp.]MDB5129203.1 hypothetical protein [Mucilaginibacter sp.]
MDQFILGAIALIFWLVLVVTFFNISGNLRKIRETLIPVLTKYQNDELQAKRLKFYVNKSLPGNELQQIIALTEIIYAELLEPTISQLERNSRYERLGNDYGAIFDRLGYQFPSNVEQK